MVQIQIYPPPELKRFPMDSGAFSDKLRVEKCQQVEGSLGPNLSSKLLLSPQGRGVRAGQPHPQPVAHSTMSGPHLEQGHEVDASEATSGSLVASLII